MKILNNRKCIVTHKVQSKDNLIRIVKKRNGEYLVDSNEQGRGAYVSRDKSLFVKLERQRLLHRTFRTEVNKEVYEKLKEKLEEE